MLAFELRDKGFVIVRRDIDFNDSVLHVFQKLDHESLLSGMPEHGGYFLSSIPDPGYKNSREYISMENNFVNGPGRSVQDLGGTLASAGWLVTVLWH